MLGRFFTFRPLTPVAPSVIGCRCSNVVPLFRRVDVAEARKRVPEEELRRQMEAFKALNGGTLDLFGRIASVSARPRPVVYRCYMPPWTGM